jgi:hypothetical protein
MQGKEASLLQANRNEVNYMITAYRQRTYLIVAWWAGMEKAPVGIITPQFNVD